MSSDLGFAPVTTGDRYFVSYSNKDAKRVGIIARSLREKGVPLWYDNAIPMDSEWEKKISKEIAGCEAVIMFATKAAFQNENSYVYKEYNAAKELEKPTYIVWLDQVNAKKDVCPELNLWFSNIKYIQGIVATEDTVENIAYKIINTCKLKTDHIVLSPPSSGNVIDDGGSAFEAIKSAITSVVNLISKRTFSNKLLAVYGCSIAFVAVIIFAKWRGRISPRPISEPTTTVYSETDSFVETTSAIESSGHAETLASIELNSKIQKGDRNVIFGNYPQGKDGEIEPLAWRVLDVKEGKALLITEKLIDRVAYNEYGRNITWEKCTLREWLNSEFIGLAFDDSERSKIVEVTNYNLDNPQFGTDGGEVTTDKVFLLSINEAEKYFDKKEDRMAIPTLYALSRGGYESATLEIEGVRTGWWFLRSPGGSSSSAAAVETDGGIYLLGSNVDNISAIVRPALWVKPDP